MVANLDFGPAAADVAAAGAVGAAAAVVVAAAAVGVDGDSVVGGGPSQSRVGFASGHVGPGPPSRPKF